MSYTPGPWKVRPISDRTLNHHRGFEISGHEDDVYIRDVLEDEVESNAALISAAPDLLDACKEFVRKCECGEARSTRSYAQMKAAITKAETV